MRILIKVCKSFTIAILLGGLLFCGILNAQIQTVRINSALFNLEVVSTPLARYKGLSKRVFLADDEGMLFIFQEVKKRTFVMRECFIPLDLIFLDEQKKITDLFEMQVEPISTPEAQLKHYNSSFPVKYAIELKGGSIKKLNIKVGQIVSY